VIVPDQRGFGASDRPDGAEHYAMPTLVTDVAGVLDALGIERAHIVGHDWGAGVAWVFATLFPQRVGRMAALSVGHPSSFARRTLEQIEKSWYMLLFSFEGLAEEMLSRDDWWFLREWSRGASDIERWIEDLSRPGALTAALNWYRANVPPERLRAEPLELPPIQTDVLGLWSTEDFALTEEQMTGSKDFVAGDWRYERIEGAGHWIPLDAPERVNTLLLEWFGG
jgi:pimeloyl-ACP methyl ester carboxylesterase